MGLFTGIADKKVRNRNEYIPEGDHTLRHKSIKLDKAFEGYDFIVAELEVVESSNPALKTDQIVSLFIKCQNGTPWMENLKGYLGAAMGYENADDVDEADVETALAADNPLLDTLVKCTGKNRPMKKNLAKSFTNLTWRAYEDEAAA